MSAYLDFIDRKDRFAEAHGFEPALEMNAALFAFQRDMVEWAIRRGRCALFAECGLGKTLMQLEWARHVADRTGLRVLIFAPLAVTGQTCREGERFGIPVAYAPDGETLPESSRIVITNYERLERFTISDFGGVVLDESSILKAYSGKVKRALVEECRDVPYRLACTATPAPNDHIELGNHAEWLGVMDSSTMIGRWFINDTTCFGTYRLKGHAIVTFWDWVASWAMCVTKPSDLGHSDDGYELPEMSIEQHVLDVDVLEDRGENLFRIPDMSATSVHREKRRTAPERAAKLAELVAAEPSEPWLIWCETDYEADALKALITEAVEVRGGHSADAKERAAVGFADGSIRVLISKPRIFGWGLNFQHCARVAFVGATFSYEKFYQALRRSWRFGQLRPVHVHVTMAQTEASVWGVLTQKRDGHDVMRLAMSDAMLRAQSKRSGRGHYCPEVPFSVPSWLKSEVSK